MAQSKSLFQLTVSKGIIIVVCSFVGAVSGLYVGRAMLDERTHAAPYFVTDSSAFPDVGFGPGDSFPPEEYTEESGAKGNFRDILLGKSSLVIFADLDCEPCHKLLNAFQMELLQRLQPNVQVVVCLPVSGGPIREESRELAVGCRLVYYDSTDWLQEYNLLEYFLFCVSVLFCGGNTGGADSTGWSCPKSMCSMGYVRSRAVLSAGARMVRVAFRLESGAGLPQSAERLCGVRLLSVTGSACVWVLVYRSN
jgi:hypothetical protein